MPSFLIILLHVLLWLYAASMVVPCFAVAGVSKAAKCLSTTAALLIVGHSLAALLGSPLPLTAVAGLCCMQAASLFNARALHGKANLSHQLVRLAVGMLLAAGTVWAGFAR